MNKYLPQMAMKINFIDSTGRDTNAACASCRRWPQRRHLPPHNYRILTLCWHCTVQATGAPPYTSNYAHPTTWDCLAARPARPPWPGPYTTLACLQCPRHSPGFPTHPGKFPCHCKPRTQHLEKLCQLQAKSPSPSPYRQDMPTPSDLVPSP